MPKNEWDYIDCPLDKDGVREVYSDNSTDLHREKERARLCRLAGVGAVHAVRLRGRGLPLEVRYVLFALYFFYKEMNF